MSVPTTVFIDTSIFDESMYNFESASMLAFKQSIANCTITLLMPDPTKREIDRHIRERAEAAVSAMKTAAKNSPFLWKLPNWPLKKKKHPSLGYKLLTIVDKELQDFFGLFQVIKLNYEGVKLDEIMNWYEWESPPFSARKKAEFPDAFTIAILERHRSASNENIAIISKDKDFEDACEKFPGLMHFASLVAYAEALQDEDERVEAIQKDLKNFDEQIRLAISEQFLDCSFTIEANWDGEATDIEITDSSSLEFHVVGIGEKSCTVAFDGDINFSAHVSYGDLDSATFEKGEPIIFHHTVEGSVDEVASISGILSISTKDHGKKIQSINSAVLDQRDFSISESPHDY